MGTKNNPGKFDCYANAAPDEPMFVLLGRDPCAPALVQLWAEMRRIMGEDASKVEEAEACAQTMREWLAKIGKTPSPIVVGLRSQAEAEEARAANLDMTTLMCSACGHQHAGIRWAYICIGCPCEERP